MDMTPDEYITELVIECENRFERFWERNIDRISDVDISDLRIIAFHVVGALDECKEIRENGLMNLQEVLKRDTVISRTLGHYGIFFDIENRILHCNGEKYDIDYEKYRSRHFLSGLDEKLDRIAHRVYYDYCVNGFLLNDDVLDYGTSIHERPEFFMTLVELSPEAERLDEYWRNHSKSFVVNFYATVEQIHRFNFELDEWRDPPYEDWNELDDEMKLKKWMLSHAIDRANNDLGMQFLYIRDDVIIPPTQIESIEEM
jgi:hypothetical protein